jgi:hypothetical protein
MLTRIWAILRTVYLFLVVAYTLWAMPWVTPTVARTFDEQYARCAGAIVPLQRAAWLAIAWIAIETLVGWLVVLRAERARRAEVPLPAASRPAP